MIKNKIKGLLSLKGYTFADYSRKLNIAPQSLQTKAKKDAYKIRDLIELADLTNTTLSFIDNETGKTLIEFDPSDIEEKETN